MTFAIVDEIIKKELGGFLHQRICSFGEERTITRELVMIPKMQTQPGGAHGPDAGMDPVNRHSMSPQICVVVNDEAAGSVKVLRQPATVFAGVLNQVEQRLRATPKGYRLPQASSSSRC